MSSPSERWTLEERRLALKAFFDSEEGRCFLEVFAHDCSVEDRQVFLRDAERRFRFDDEEAGRWWNSLRILVQDSQYLALAEPMAQIGIGIDELYECLPDDFDPLVLRRAIDLAVGIKQGKRGVLTPLSFTNTAGWSVEQIRDRLEDVKEQLGWQRTNDDARAWWETFESGDESKQRLELVLRLAEELASRRAEISDFHEAYHQANTENIQAVFHYLDYSRLKTKAAQSPVAANQSGLTSGDTGWWLKPAPRMTRVRGWTDEQIRNRLEEVKALLGWEKVAPEIRAWWESFEKENTHRLALVLRLAEELANRNGTFTEFHRSLDLAQTSDIQANLFYLDYQRLTTDKYTYETAVLDETGGIIERRIDEAHHFFEELAPGIPLEMVEILGGTFLMGTNDVDGGKAKKEIARYTSKENAESWVKSEMPQHEVTVSPFHIGKFAITQEQWGVVAGWEKIERDLNPDPANFKGQDHPVETVSWHEAQEFCARLSKKTGRFYRLPTEAEWEYACRAGTVTPFALGETITPEFVNYNGQYPYAKAEKGEYRERTIPVGSLGIANAFGLFDMHGNVWEWCEDVWHANYEGAPTDGSAWLSGGGSSHRVLRGGSWNYDGDFCRSAGRVNYVPDARNYNLGFRVVLGARTP